MQVILEVFQVAQNGKDDKAHKNNERQSTNDFMDQSGKFWKIMVREHADDQRQNDDLQNSQNHVCGRYMNRLLKGFTTGDKWR